MTMTSVMNGALSHHEAMINRLGRGLERHWYHDFQVVSYVPLLSNTATIELWRMVAMEDIYGWPHGRPHLVIHDLSRLNPKPYVQKTIESIVRYYPRSRSGRYAIVINDLLIIDIEA